MGETNITSRESKNFFCTQIHKRRNARGISAYQTSEDRADAVKAKLLTGEDEYERGT